MSTGDVEQLIAAWEERLKRVDENLIALEGEPTYQMLAGSAGQRAPLEGVTAERVSPALDALSELFEYRERLTEVLDRAKELHESTGFFDKEQKASEIRQLLSGPSIKLGTRPTPLAQRNLLDPASNDVAVVPEQLLSGMANAYQKARDEVMAVSRAWAKLEPWILAAEHEGAGLRKLATDLGVQSSVDTEFSALEAELGALRTRVARDPLGVEWAVDGSLGPRMGALRKWLGELAATRDRVQNGLRSAASLEREVLDANRAAEAAIGRAPQEIEGATVPPAVDASLMHGLAPWREKIEKTASAGRWGPADVGLGRWFETARGYLAAAQAVVRALDALVAARTELAGRLSARRAQLLALGSRGQSYGPELETAGRQAEQLLRTRPTALADARAAVEAFEAQVVALAAKGRR